MTYFSERLTEQLQIQGLTKYRLAKLAEVPESTMNHICSGKRRPTDEVLERMGAVDELLINAETLNSWRLLDDYDKGTIINVATAQLEQDPALSQFVQALKQTESGESSQLLPVLLKVLQDNQLFSGFVETLKTSIEVSSPLQASFEKPVNFRRLPCRGYVAAGRLEFSQKPEDITYYDWAEVPFYGDANLFCLRVEGQSMAPMIPHGAVLMLRPADRLENGGVYVIETSDHKMTCKLVEVSHDGLTLLPINPEFDDIAVEGFDIAKAYQVVEYKVSLI